MVKRVNSFRTAPASIKKRWTRTGYELAIFHMVDKGMTWEEADDRAMIAHRKWWDRTQGKKTHPLLRYQNMIFRERVLEDVEAGRLKHYFEVKRGRTYVHTPNNSAVLARG